MPVVSIIIPIYKVEAYLRECLESILNQTCRDYELILVDDGSPDNCGAICNEYAEKDSRIRVIHKPNGGLSDARNAGLDVASGKYVYFLDSDDTVEPNLLETVVPYMEQGADLVAFSLRGFYDDGTVLSPSIRQAGEYITDTPEKRLEFYHQTLLQGKIGWDAWSRIFVREKIEEYGLRFADNRKIFAEDLFFSLCYCAHAEHIVSLDASLYNYRLRSDSIMSVQNTRNNLPRIQCLADNVLAYYQQFRDCDLLSREFPRLWYQIFMNQFVYQILNVDDPAAFRNVIIQETSQWDAVAKTLKNQLNDRTYWRKQYSWVRYWELTANTKFLLCGSLKSFKWSTWMVRRIKNQYERLNRIVP